MVRPRSACLHIIRCVHPLSTNQHLYGTASSACQVLLCSACQDTAKAPPVVAAASVRYRCCLRALPLLPPCVAPAGPGGYAPMHARIHRGQEQYQAGVRVDEFHDLSTVAPFVAPAAAIKLQNLWDAGVKLVSLLDER